MGDYSWVGPALGAAGGYLGSKSQGKQQDVTTTQEIPEWLKEAYQWNMGAGQGYAQRPYVPYLGERYAGFNPTQQQGFASADLYGQMGLGALGNAYNAMLNPQGKDMMQNAYGGLMGMAGMSAGLGLGGSALGTPQSGAMYGQYASAGPAAQVGYAAQAPAAAQLGYTAQAQAAKDAQASLASRGNIQDVAGGSYLDMNIKDYMNPYTEGVMDNVLSDSNRNWLQQEQQLNSAANAASAFGGSRHGVQGALSASENQRNTNQLSNQLWNQAYGAATNLMGDDLQRGLQAGLANQGMDWNVENLNANLGTQTSQFNTGQRNAMNQFNAGQQNQVGMFNTGQQNQVGMFNAGQQNQVGMYNVGQQNEMAAYNAGNLNNMNQFNAQLGTLNNQFNTGNLLQNQQFNQNLGMQGLQQAMSGINMAGGLGNSLNNAYQNQGVNLSNFGIQGLANQMAAGNQMQGQQQQQRDFDYQQFLEARDWYPNQLAWATGSMPGGDVGGSTTQPYWGPNPWTSAMGGAMMGYGLQNSMNGYGNNIPTTPYTTGYTVAGSGGQSPQDFYSYRG